MPTKASYRIPFDERGNLMHYAMEDWQRPANVTRAHEWRDREPFLAKLTLTDHRRGHSAAYFIWQDEEGRTYPMFVVDLFHLVRSGAYIQAGVCQAEWIGTKRGANYGIKLAGS